MNKSVCIVGSGLVGTLTSIFLAKYGYNVDIYEKRSDPRVETCDHGRSIALSLSKRGWDALSKAGLSDAILPFAKPSYARSVHVCPVTVHDQNYGDGSQAIWTINRNFLNVTLLDAAQKTNKVNIFFHHLFKEMNEKNGEIIFENTISGERVCKKYDHIFAVDGAFSAVRRHLEKKNVWKFDEVILDYEYKELTFSCEESCKKLAPNNSVHVWPRKKSIFIAFPTIENKFIGTIFLPKSGEDSFEDLNCPVKFKTYLEKEYPDAIKYLPDIERQIRENPVSNLMQVKGGPWNYEDKVLLMGDASHATTPFYGMGMNIGFEDCTVFMEQLEKNSLDLGKTIREFSDLRKLDADTMTEMSYENFSSLKESPDENYEKKWVLERKIWRLLPKSWVPIYVLITSSNIPIRQIPSIKKRQNSILCKLVSENKDILSVTDNELKDTVLSLLKDSEEDLVKYLA